MVTGPLVVELILVKGWLFTLGQMPTIVWKKAGLIKKIDDNEAGVVQILIY